jgi:hypothetical protein
MATQILPRNTGAHHITSDETTLERIAEKHRRLAALLNQNEKTLAEMGAMIDDAYNRLDRLEQATLCDSIDLINQDLMGVICGE